MGAARMELHPLTTPTHYLLLISAHLFYLALIEYLFNRKPLTNWAL